MVKVVSYFLRLLDETIQFPGLRFLGLLPLRPNFFVVRIERHRIIGFGIGTRLEGNYKMFLFGKINVNFILI